MAFFGKKKVPNQLEIQVTTNILNKDLSVRGQYNFNIVPTKITLSNTPINGVIRNDLSVLALHFRYTGNAYIAKQGIFGGGLGQQHVWVATKVNKDSYIGLMYTNEDSRPFSVGYLRQLQNAGAYNGSGNVQLLNYIFGAGHKISPTIPIELS